MEEAHAMSKAAADLAVKSIVKAYSKKYKKDKFSIEKALEEENYAYDQLVESDNDSN